MKEQKKNCTKLGSEVEAEKEDGGGAVIGLEDPELSFHCFFAEFLSIETQNERMKGEYEKDKLLPAYFNNSPITPAMTPMQTALKDPTACNCSEKKIKKNSVRRNVMEK